MPTKVHIVKALVFPVVMYGYKSWITKKAEHQRIDIFELWCWKRLLRVPWTARRSNQRILKEINTEYSLEGLMLKLQYFPASGSVLHIRWPKHWSFSLSISPFNDYSGLISFRIDWFDLFAIQETLKRLLQHHSSKSSVLWR